jgi:prepilin peptidase CpaA
METTSFQLAALAIAGVAVCTDTKRGIIPNKLTFPAVLIGCVFHGIIGGWDGLGFALSGAGLGLALFLLPFLVGNMGAGDVKLLAALGAFVGPQVIFGTFFFSVILGGAMGLVILLKHSGLEGMKLTAMTGLGGLLSLSQGGTRLGFPFASAIFFGLVASFLVK